MKAGTSKKMMFMENNMKVDVLSGADVPLEVLQDYIRTNTPVLVKRYASDWPAIKNWNLDFFNKKFGETNILTKEFLANGEIRLSKRRLKDYLTLVENFDRLYSAGQQVEVPPYWHDVPIFHLFPELTNDVKNFDERLLPTFYRREWPKYAQFFLSAPGSVTKLHFDTLRTNNLFFQVMGTKRWTLIDPSETHLCGRKKWRWFDVNPEKPDYEKHPQYKTVNPYTVDVGPGDLLYIPSGTLHHVRSLDTCISFNIDFHTFSSVIKSFSYMFKGMPGEVMFYNFIIILGLFAKVPEKYLFPFYRPYLNYIS